MSLGEFLGSWSAVTKWLYKLDNNANDSSGNWANWTATNVAYVSGKIWSNCWQFNNTSSKITTAVTLWTVNSNKTIIPTRVVSNAQPIIPISKIVDETILFSKSFVAFFS